MDAPASKTKCFQNNTNIISSNNICAGTLLYFVGLAGTLAVPSGRQQCEVQACKHMRMYVYAYEDCGCL